MFSRVDYSGFNVKIFSLQGKETNKTTCIENKSITLTHSPTLGSNKSVSQVVSITGAQRILCFGIRPFFFGRGLIYIKRKLKQPQNTYLCFLTPLTEHEHPLIDLKVKSTNGRTKVFFFFPKKQ